MLHAGSPSFLHRCWCCCFGCCCCAAAALQQLLLRTLLLMLRLRLLRRLIHAHRCFDSRSGWRLPLQPVVVLRLLLSALLHLLLQLLLLLRLLLWLLQRVLSVSSKGTTPLYRWRSPAKGPSLPSSVLLLLQLLLLLLLVSLVLAMLQRLLRLLHQLLRVHSERPSPFLQCDRYDISCRVCCSWHRCDSCRRRGFRGSNWCNLPPREKSLPPPLLWMLLLLLPLLRTLLRRMLLLPGRTTPFLIHPCWLLPWLVLVLVLQPRNCRGRGSLLRGYGCCRAHCCLPREKCRLTPRNLLKGLV